jgi:hypothetical protein
VLQRRSWPVVQDKCTYGRMGVPNLSKTLSYTIPVGLSKVVGHTVLVNIHGTSFGCMPRSRMLLTMSRVRCALSPTALSTVLYSKMSLESLPTASLELEKQEAKCL